MPVQRRVNGTVHTGKVSSSAVQHGEDGAGILQPFARVDSNMSTWTRLKVGLGLVTLAPLRIVSLVSLLGAYGLTLATFTAVGAPTSLVLTITRCVSRATLFLLGFYSIEEDMASLKFHSHDTHAAHEQQPCIIVANHISYLEILYFMSTRFCPSFVMKKTCLKVPLVGYVAMKLGGVLVDREGGGETSASEVILQRTREHPASAQPLLIFPEGTTTNGSCLLQFKTGAFRPGLPVLPVVIEFPFAEQQFSPAYESVHTPTHLLRMLAQWSHQLRVKYLPIYKPDAEERSDARLYAEHVRAQMSEALGIPAVEQSYADKLVYHKELMEHYKRAGPWSLYLYVRPDLLPESDATSAAK